MHVLSNFQYEETSDIKSHEEKTEMAMVLGEKLEEHILKYQITEDDLLNYDETRIEPYESGFDRFSWVSSGSQVGSKNWVKKKSGVTIVTAFELIMNKVCILLNQKNPKKIYFILGDNQNMHLNLDLMLRLKSSSLEMLFLPDQTSNFLQPLEAQPFRKMKNDFNEVQAETSISSIAQVVSTSLTKAIVQGGFESCGIYPFCSEKIKNASRNPLLEKAGEIRDSFLQKHVKTILESVHQSTIMGITQSQENENKRMREETENSTEEPQEEVAIQERKRRKIQNETQ